MSDKNFMWPDYKNCSANLPNSIMKKFGVQTVGDTLPLLDEYLKKDYKNIVVILLDGMGINILENNLKEDDFFRTHLAGEYNSVFPPTTVAATTSVMNGLMPCEHGWLGWDCYYPQIDKNVTVFLNSEQGSDEQAADYNVANEYTGYESIFDRFEKAGAKAHLVMPFAPPFPDTFEKVANEIKSICKEDYSKYIYAYWSEPDSTMHDTGCYSNQSKEVLNKLQDQVKKLCEELSDTLVIVTADHGHIDSKGVTITDYPSITECLVRMPSIEPRALNFFVKEEKREQFENEFNKFFKDDFILLTKEEVLKNRVFGTGTEHKNFQGMLGDYLGVAIGDVSIFNNKEEAGKFIGVHAGITADEVRIPLIICES